MTERSSLPDRHGEARLENREAGSTARRQQRTAFDKLASLSRHAARLSQDEFPLAITTQYFALSDLTRLKHNRRMRTFAETKPEQVIG